MTALSKWCNTHSRMINRIINFLLLLSMLLSYILIIILYASPGSYHIRSLLDPSASGIKPATAVTLVTAVLAASTSSLATRCVEQSLWLKLAPRFVKKPLTIAESRRLAQWSVSPFAHLTYLFDGDSWRLKFGGILLIALAIVGPVLLSGISLVESFNTTQTFKNRDSDPWTGWIDAASQAYNGGNFQDIQGTTAALATLSNLSAPASPACSNSRCQVDTVVASIQATCESSYGKYANPPLDYDRFSVCSDLNADICTVIGGSSPYTYANFSSGFPADCGETCPTGDFAVIFGTFTNGTDTLKGPWYHNIVDCSLSYGTVRVQQIGKGSPVLHRSEFEKSDSVLDSSAVPLRRIYTDSYERSPYTFGASSGTGDGADSLYNSAVATLLLREKAHSSAEEVARRIEDIFDMATLLAFSRAPNASDLSITTREPFTRYVYDERVLAILLVPFLATILGTWGRWKVEGTGQVIGYDPVAIAERGPIQGLPEDVSRSREDIDEKTVVGYQETTTTSTGTRVNVTRFAIGSRAT
ncbi:hypothetical protein ACKAV7_010789 [Fusarium commune]|uniref:Uncharacterized protein n=1 Tax=Fusarium oxysporum f. sp. rapae TaxID=485398 RepID=A0A8J5TTU6_FUSOX|nr:hypothetical protein Forpe1208_v010706 [Fusarium oxysporum f. sp. rapae]KAI7760028.1 hypothetical protein LZL87_012399 [Fusarium oxysporum]